MRTVAIIQARVGSTRLPSKVLMDLAGEPMLVRVVNRVKRAKLLDYVVVATTVNPRDRTIFELCNDHGYICMNGSEEDVLDRYWQVATAFHADLVVRITSDCPLIEPAIIDKVVAEMLATHRDYVSNFVRRTYPRGLDCEIITQRALHRAWLEDREWREHVTPYVYKHPEQFSIGSVTNDEDFSHMRWTVDTSEDLAFVRKVYDHFGHDRFSWRDVLEVLKANPQWEMINANVEQKPV